MQSSIVQVQHAGSRDSRALRPDEGASDGAHPISTRLEVLDVLFDRPIFRSTDFLKRSGIPEQSASRFLGILRKANILQALRQASGREPAILVFRDLLNCAEGRAVF